VAKKIKVVEIDFEDILKDFALRCLPNRTNRDWESSTDNHRATYAQGWNDCIRCIEDNVEDAIEEMRNPNDKG
jgi:hypothetical protein